MLYFIEVCRFDIESDSAKSKRERVRNGNDSNNDYYADYDARVFCVDDLHRRPVEIPRKGCYGLRFRLAQCRTLAERLCLRYFVFFRRHFCGLRRTVWLELRSCLYLDRSRQRVHRFPACMADSRPAYQDYDKSSRKQNNARFFRCKIWLPRIKNRGFHYHLPVPDSLHRFAL